ncbi:A disintegrin and metalloproteinase with thrombospondin motifs 2-like [Hetaerina americana]|uniref:A disintegrin and metalloproteinase with thrombospondin motifs 2-like n=1 Tax=Hetaerina americana TaxID=62018 RepID=UPI003A7F6024
MRARRDLAEDKEDEVGHAVDESSEEEPLAGGRRPVVVSVPPSVPDHLGATLAQQVHLTTRWLKMAIAVDHTVVKFHGRENAAQYVLALMNIVSAIYKDPSLDSNLRIVIVRMIFYDKEKEGQVEEGNPKQSLEHVNAWNENLLKAIAIEKGVAGTRHDVAVWLTRLDLGGPSGYAPVSGACDPARSCALNRDEGLSSAFIIAHEVGHVLGMTHDGDLSAGNDCGAEAQEGSVMAPMVAAAFNRFHWSPCSREEFHSKAPQWTCLDDPPPHSTNATVLGSSLHAAFSMDEQCRLEFGDGYTLCHSFELPDPCTHLWCSHHSSPLVCKTKKGPPLEGTECGYEKWCVNGFCETVDRKSGTNKSVVRYNARDGGWSSWSDWGPCSRSCGHGVTFRIRTCDNPRPEFGGSECAGSSEEFDVCGVSKCPHTRDFRAEQCAKLTALILMERRLASLTWLPHELEPVTHKCQLACVSKETGEVYASGENLIDGTPCSYDLDSGICVQGHCQDMGCDGMLDSEVKEDYCGRCGGNGSSCQNVTLTFKRLLRRRLTRVAVLPSGARNIKIEAHSELMDPPVTFLVLRDRRKRAFALTGQENCIQRSGRTHSCAEGVKIPRSANVVAEGALFHYEHHGPLQTLWARGPILSELVLSVSVLQVGPGVRARQGVSAGPVGHQVRVHGSYTAEGLVQESRHEWREGTFPGGSRWSPCSATCGGGRQHKNLVCTDSKTGKSVPRRLCSLALKPQNPTRQCNTFSCSFEWVAGPWEPCTATCGARGVQSREIYCIHSNVSTLITHGLAQPWDHFVDPIRCGGAGWQWPRATGLDTIMPCNRVPCPVEWVTGNWSQCAAKGEGSHQSVWGEERRLTRCPAPRGEPLYTCGRPPPEQRPCRLNSGAEVECTRDTSPYCPQVSRYLGRYCLIPDFRDICCVTCSNIPPEHYL